MMLVIDRRVVWRVRSASSTSSVNSSSWNQGLSLSVTSGNATSRNILQQLQPAYVIIGLSMSMYLHACAASLSRRHRGRVVHN